MWLVGNKASAISIYLGETGFTVLRSAKVLHTENTADPLQAIGQMDRWLSAQGRSQKVSVYLSGALCRPFLGQVPDTLSAMEAQAAWRIAASQKTGVATSCTVWHDSNHRSVLQIACVVANEVLDGVQRAGIKGRSACRITSIQPAWGEWLRYALHTQPECASVVLHEPDGMTVLSGPGSDFELARCVLHPGDEEQSQTTLNRLLMAGSAPDGKVSRARMSHAPQKTSALASALSPLLEIHP